MANYEIIIWDDDGNWSADGIGSPNEFASIEEAHGGIESLIALGAEWRSCIYAIREIGMAHPERGSSVEGPDEICAYCESQVTLHDVPAINDDEAWAECASEHAASCEWVSTRAFLAYC